MTHAKERRMNRLFILILSIWCLSSVITVAQTPQARQKPVNQSGAIDPQAMTALNRMSDYLKTLKAFRINSEVSKDELVDRNMKIQKSASNEIFVLLPDRLHAHMAGDEQDLQIIYNGRTFTVYDPAGKHYATAPAPATVARTLDAIRARYGIVFPLADFIQMSSQEKVLQNITAAGYIGASRIDGVECDHIAVRQPDVDWQVWIEKGEKPLPRKIVITTKTQATQPQYIATLKWDTTSSVDSNLFTFTPPADAVRIRFARRANN
jgi:hypothetical protein